MNSNHSHETLIIGGGLSDLHTAYRLAQLGQDFVLLEGRNRFGGRIHSRHGIDLGGSWFWPGHDRIAYLLEELGLRHFSQFTQGLALYETSRQTPCSRPMFSRFLIRGARSELLHGQSTRKDSQKRWCSQRNEWCSRFPIDLLAKSSSQRSSRQRQCARWLPLPRQDTLFRYGVRYLLWWLYGGSD